MPNYLKVTILVPGMPGPFASHSGKAQDIAADWIEAIQQAVNLDAEEAVVKVESRPQMYATSEEGTFWQRANRRHREESGERVMEANGDFGYHELFAPQRPAIDMTEILGSLFPGIAPWKGTK